MISPWINTRDCQQKTLEEEAKVEPRLKTRLGWRHLAKKMDVFKSVIKAEQQPSPWTQYKNVKIEKVELEKKKAEYTEEQLKAIATAKINSTDGSTDGKQPNGGAGTYIEDANGGEVATYEEPAGALCSSYGGECVAMLRACKWIREKEQRKGE